MPTEKPLPFDSEIFHFSPEVVQQKVEKEAESEESSAAEMEEPIPIFIGPSEKESSEEPLEFKLTHLGLEETYGTGIPPVSKPMLPLRRSRSEPVLRSVQVRSAAVCSFTHIFFNSVLPNSGSEHSMTPQQCRHPGRFLQPNLQPALRLYDAVHQLENLAAFWLRSTLAFLHLLHCLARVFAAVLPSAMFPRAPILALSSCPNEQTAVQPLRHSSPCTPSLFVD